MILISLHNGILNFIEFWTFIIDYIYFLFFYVRLSYFYFLEFVMNSFFLHLLYIGLFLFSNEDRGVSFVTDGIVANVKFDTNDSKYPEN